MTIRNIRPYSSKRMRGHPCGTHMGSSLPPVGVLDVGPTLQATLSLPPLQPRQILFVVEACQDDSDLTNRSDALATARLLNGPLQARAKVIQHRVRNRFTAMTTQCFDDLFVGNETVPSNPPLQVPERSPFELGVHALLFHAGHLTSQYRRAGGTVGRRAPLRSSRALGRSDCGCRARHR